MDKKKLIRYLVSMFIFQIIIIMVGILPFDTSSANKLEFIIITNIGLFSGTLGVLYNVWKNGLNNM